MADTALRGQMPAGGPSEAGYIWGGLRLPKVWPMSLDQSKEALQILLNETDGQMCACGTC